MATDTLEPDSDVAVAGWTATPLWSKINEDIDSPDGTVITNTTRNQDGIVGQSDSPSDVATVTEVILRLRASGTPDNTHGINLTLESADRVTTFATLSTGTVLTSALADFTTGAVSVSMSKAQIDDAVLAFRTIDPAMADAGDWKIDTINNDITYTPTAADDEEFAATSPFFTNPPPPPTGVVSY